MGKLAATALRLVVLLGLTTALLMGFAVVSTMSSPSLGASSIKLVRETFSSDPDVVVHADYNEITKNPTNQSAVGDSAPGEEAKNSLPVILTALIKGNFRYQFVVKEAEVNSWQAGDRFKVDVYGDNGVSNDLLATLYLKQDTVDNTKIEGVTVQVDSGSPDEFPDIFSIVITRQ